MKLFSLTPMPIFVDSSPSLWNSIHESVTHFEFSNMVDFSFCDSMFEAFQVPQSSKSLSFDELYHSCLVTFYGGAPILERYFYELMAYGFHRWLTYENFSEFCAAPLFN